MVSELAELPGGAQRLGEVMRHVLSKDAEMTVQCFSVSILFALMPIVASAQTASSDSEHVANGRVRLTYVQGCPETDDLVDRINALPKPVTLQDIARDTDLRQHLGLRINDCSIRIIQDDTKAYSYRTTWPGILSFTAAAQFYNAALDYVTTKDCVRLRSAKKQIQAMADAMRPSNVLDDVRQSMGKLQDDADGLSIANCT